MASSFTSRFSGSTALSNPCHSALPLPRQETFPFYSPIVMTLLKCVVTCISGCIWTRQTPVVNIRTTRVLSSTEDSCVRTSSQRRHVHRLESSAECSTRSTMWSVIISILVSLCIMNFFFQSATSHCSVQYNTVLLWYWAPCSRSMCTDALCHDILPSGMLTCINSETTSHCLDLSHICIGSEYSVSWLEIYYHTQYSWCLLILSLLCSASRSQLRRMT